MNRATPIVLLALVILAGTYVMVFEMRRTPDAEQIELESRVFKVRTADVETARGITLARGNSVVTLAKGRDGAWRLTQPVEAVARQEAVSGLVRDVLLVRRGGGTISADRLDPKGLPAYGLDAPRIVATVRLGEDASDRELVLQIGNEDPTKRYVYAKQPRDSGVALVDRWVAERLAQPANEYRETRIVRFDPARLKAVKLRSTLGALDLEAKGGEWEATKPFADRVDSLRMEDVLRALGGIEAKAFTAEAAGNLAPFGLDRPRVEASVVRDDNSTLTVLLGGPCKDPLGTVYAKLADEPAVYAVDESAVAKLTFPAEFLRNRRPATVSSSSVGEFAVERPGAKLVVKKESGRWKIVAPAAADAEADAVDNFLRAVSSLDVLRFADDAPDDAALTRCGLDEKSRATLTLKQPGKPDLVFDVGRVDEKQKDLYARRRGAPGIFTVPESFAAWMTANPLDFIARKVASFSRAGIRKLVVRRPEGGVTVEKAVDGKWRMTAPAAAPADEISVGAILDDIAELTAVKFLAAKADKPADFGLDRPSFELVVETEAGKDKPAETRTISVGKDAEAGGFAAKLSGAETVFVVSGEFVQHLRAELRKRQIWRLDPAGITEVVWQSGAQKVVARREENAWKLIEPAGRAPDTEAFDTMLNAVSDHPPQRFEAYSKDNLARFGLDKPRATLTVTAEGRDYVLFVGADKDATSVYVCVSTEDAVFTLSKNIAVTLLTLPLAPLAPPPLLTPPAK